MIILKAQQAMSRAIDYMLRTFNTGMSIDLEGLSLRIAFLNFMVDNGLCSLDSKYRRRKDVDAPRQKIEWMNRYLREIDGHLKRRLDCYEQVLDLRLPPWKERFEFTDIAAREEAEKIYLHLDYENLFSNCNRCPRRYYCFCQLKTFLCCTFSGSTYTDPESYLNTFLRPDREAGKPSFASMTSRWLEANCLDRSLLDPKAKVYRTGFPYLIKGAVEKHAAEIGGPRSEDDWEDDHYVNIDPYVTASLLQLLSDSKFIEAFRLGDELKMPRGSTLYEKTLMTLVDLQNQDEAEDMMKMKEWKVIKPDHCLIIRKYPIFGSWDEGFWGGIKVNRIKSTSDIARILYELEGSVSDKVWPTIARAIEFVVRAFVRNPSEADNESDNYVLDEQTFRGIHVSPVSNISGTIGALRLLVSIKEAWVSIGKSIRDLLSEDVQSELYDLESFVEKKIRWLIEQQRHDGGFPYLSDNFIETTYCPMWIPNILKSPEEREAINVSLNNTWDAILLFYEYLQSRAEMEVKYAFVPANKDYIAYQTLLQIFEEAENTIFLADSYVDESIVDVYLSRVKPSVKTIQILTREVHGSFLEVASKFNRERSNLEVYLTDEVHDRFVVTDKGCWHIGASIKDAGRRATMITSILQDRVKESINKYLTSLSRIGKRVIPPSES